MKHVIIGTAGHIDHGKTTLIKALTGRDTDTLKEEKDRGISINLGFTFFDLPSGRRAGIIDVPGHEKFIKNMLAGASGIDVVMLVIAADEGIMPQTREHLEILQLLSVKKGIVVLTKSDLVEEDWLELIKEDIGETFKDTFLKNADIFAVSSKTGKGMEELINAIDAASEEVEAKDTGGHFRLPIDRVFSVSGFGTVVTGTIISGFVNMGDTLEVYPSGLKAKVRNIQVHEEHVSYAEAGQRCALNLAGVKGEEIKRGNVAAAEEFMSASMIVDCNLYYLKSAERPLVNRQRVRLYHGTDEVLCRVIILDRESVKPGETAYVQLRLESPVTVQRKDRFVIRSYSPMHTIGGGVIIEPAASKAKPFNEKYIETLKLKESGKTENIIENTVEKLSFQYPGIFEILKALGKNEEAVEEKLQQMINSRQIIKLVSQEKIAYIHKSFLKEKIVAIEGILTSFHKENPLKAGMFKEELKGKVFGKTLKQKLYDEMLKLLEERHVIRVIGGFVCLEGFKIQYSDEQIDKINRILQAFSERKYSPPKYEELAVLEKDKKAFKMVYDSLIESGRLIRLSQECTLLKEDLDSAKSSIINYIKDKGSLTAAEGRDLLNTSRKFAVAILEYFDSIKLTKRVEESRVLY
jgi:selenocysteine-specific elongation factor